MATLENGMPCYINIINNRILRVTNIMLWCGFNFLKSLLERELTKWGVTYFDNLNSIRVNSSKAYILE